MHVCMCRHAHMCGGHPQPPYLDKKFEGPNPIGSRDMAHYVIGCKTSNFLIKVWGGGGWVGGVWHQTPPTTTPKLQLDFKSKKSSCSLGVVVGGCLASDPPTTTPKLQLDFKSKKSSCSLGVVGGGCLASDPPPTTTPKLQLDLKSKKSSCSLGVVVVGGGLEPDTPPPPPPPQTLTRKFSKSKKLS